MAVRSSRPAIYPRYRPVAWVATIAMSLLLMSCGGTSVPAPPSPVVATPPGLSLTNEQRLPVTAKVKLGQMTIDLEVAQTPEQQSLGLMYRRQLADDRGMLFPFSPARFTRFWMKNVSLNLDMVFFLKGRVVYIANDVPPCTTEPCPTYGTDGPVDGVIELRGGRAAALGIKVGDPVVVEKI
jgi:uncharacterized protein